MHCKNYGRLLLLLLLVVGYASSACNECNLSSEQACVSDNAFKVCEDGTASGAAENCPTGYKCNYDGLCAKEADIVQLGCVGCKECNAAGVFACLTTTTFALCLGKGEPQEIQGTCSPGTYCNWENANICSEEPPTCSFDADPTLPPATTTPSVLPNTSEFCAYIKKEGRYPVGSDKETTCRQYARCINHNENWIGAIYQCPKGTYFNAATTACGSEVPASCSSTVASIQVANFRLG